MSVLSRRAAVSAGSNSALALRGDGIVIAWGDNTYGETNLPLGLSNVTAISAGDNFALALGTVEVSPLLMVAMVVFGGAMIVGLLVGVVALIWFLGASKIASIRIPFR